MAKWHNTWLRKILPSGKSFIVWNEILIAKKNRNPAMIQSIKTISWFRSKDLPYCWLSCKKCSKLNERQPVSYGLMNQGDLWCSESDLDLGREKIFKWTMLTGCMRGVAITVKGSLFNLFVKKWSTGFDPQLPRLLWIFNPQFFVLLIRNGSGIYQ